MNTKDQMDVMETAADWCDRLEHLADAERQELRLWLVEPEHARAFDHVRRTMQDVALLDAASDLKPATKPRSRLSAWFAAVFTKKTSWGVLVGAAAAISAMILLRPQSPVPQSLGSQPQVLATATGERREAMLADKSIVYLDADTQIAVTYSDRIRQLNLTRGEAIFQVTKDKARPFRVGAGSAMVTAVGTRFGVDRVDDAVEVRVYEGTVKVEGNGAKDRAVAHGQWLLLDPRRGVSIGTFSPEVYPNWRTGWLAADRMPLPYAIARLNRYSNDKIEIADRSLADVDLTGRFRLDNTEGTLKQISALLDVEAERRNHEILLHRRQN